MSENWLTYTIEVIIVIMEKLDAHDKKENIKQLMRLANALFELTKHTNDPRQLERLRKMAAPLQGLLDDKEDVLDPNLGIELNEYVQIKEYDEHDESGWVQMYGEATEERLKEIDSRFHFTQDC